MNGAGQNDIPPATYNFRLYSGKMLELYGRNLYKLDGKLCKGAFTGDDFCDVSGCHVVCTSHVDIVLFLYPFVGLRSVRYTVVAVVECFVRIVRVLLGYTAPDVGLPYIALNADVY